MVPYLVVGRSDPDPPIHELLVAYQDRAKYFGSGSATKATYQHHIAISYLCTVYFCFLAVRPYIVDPSLYLKRSSLVACWPCPPERPWAVRPSTTFLKWPTTAARHRRRRPDRKAVLRIRIHRIHMFLALLYPNPSIIMQK